MQVDQTSIDIEVAYASIERKSVIKIVLEIGDNVSDAILKSKILDLYPEIDIGTNKVGVFGKLIKSPEKYLLRSGDRVEIYRPLLVSSKASKKQ